MSGMAVVGAPIGPPGKEGEVLGRDGIFLRVKSDEEGRRVRCCMQMQKLLPFSIPFFFGAADPGETETQN